MSDRDSDASIASSGSNRTLLEGTQLDFHLALVQISLPPIAASALITQGIKSMTDLHYVDAGDIKQVIKTLRHDGLVLPMLAVVHLQTMCYWVQKCLRLCLSIDPHEFMMTVAEEWTAKKKAAPEKFKKDMKWHEFHDSFVTYLHAKNGQEAMFLMNQFLTQSLLMIMLA